MNYKVLYLFVEGSDDERFIKSVIEPLFIEHYNYIKYIPFAQQTKVVVENLVRPLNHNPNCDYFFVCDMDARGDINYCITSRKDKLNSSFGKNIDPNRIIVVKEEIESWYFAGIFTDAFKDIKSIPNTELLSKEEFEKLIPKQFSSKSDFMIEILKNFSNENAIQLNTSFAYFMTKIKLLLNIE